MAKIVVQFQMFLHFAVDDGETKMREGEKEICVIENCAESLYQCSVSSVDTVI